MLAVSIRVTNTCSFIEGHSFPCLSIALQLLCYCETELETKTSYHNESCNWRCATMPLHVLKGSIPDSSASMSTLAPRQTITTSYSSGWTNAASQHKGKAFHQLFQTSMRNNLPLHLVKLQLSCAKLYSCHGDLLMTSCWPNFHLLGKVPGKRNTIKNLSIKDHITIYTQL